MLSSFFKPKQIIVVVFLAATLFLTACATTEKVPEALQQTAIEKATLGDVEAQEFFEVRAPQQSSRVYRSGDIAEVEIYNEAGLSGKYIVDSYGNSTYPYIGEIEVAGLTSQQLQEKLTELYGRSYFQNPNVLVATMENENGYIVVDGFVSKPGVIQLTDVMKVSEAIARAGGISEEGDSTNVFVVRQNGEKRTPFKIDLDDVRLAQAPDPVLLPSDIIFVKEEGYKFDYDEVLRTIPLLNFAIIAATRF